MSIKLSSKLKTALFCVFFTLVLIFIIWFAPRLKKSEKNMNYELPAAVGDHQIVVHNGYTLSYNEEYEVADWVAYVLDIKELNAKVTGRNENFAEDPAIVTQSAHLSDYKGSGYKKGQLLNFLHRANSVELSDETFLLSNIAPMKGRFGILLNAEDAERRVAYTYGKVYAVTGPVFSDDMKRIGECNVAVPKAFYKVLLFFDKDGSAYSIGMILPQDFNDENLSSYLCTVDEVEKQTGLDFFVNLPNRVEKQVEKQKLLYKWPKCMQ